MKNQEVLQDKNNQRNMNYCYSAISQKLKYI